jgi:UDP-3-O-[3-hydroxymyristoyl] glucosamine N-acyltransferase
MSDAMRAGRGTEDRSLTVAQVASLVGGELSGDPAVVVRDVAPVFQAGPRELGFLADRRYLRFLPETGAGALLVSQELAEEASDVTQARVMVREPHVALTRLLAHFHPEERDTPEIHPTAVLGRGVRLGREVAIGPYAVLEEEVVVGDGARIGAHACVGKGSVIGAGALLHPHVVLYPRTVIGERVILHAGVRLGVDGFGYVFHEGEHRKVPQVGSCTIGDDVEIGANSCIDRGSIGRTEVGAGTKLDNLVHLGHNVRVGSKAIVVAQVGVAGSTRIGDGAMLGGQAGLVGHLEIAPGARIGAQAGVIGDVSAGEPVVGFPARPRGQYLRGMTQMFKLPELVRQVRTLEARLDELERASGSGAGDA